MASSHSERGRESSSASLTAPETERSTSPPSGSPARPRRDPPGRGAPVVVLLGDAAVRRKPQPRRPRERSQLAVLHDHGPPLDRHAVAVDQRLAPPELGLALLLGERPARVVERMLGLAKRMRVMN